MREASVECNKSALGGGRLTFYDHFVAIAERQLGALDIWPSADDLNERLASGGLVLLPDDVSEIDGETVASFREASHAIQIGARNAGIPVEFVAPPGARLGVYRERAADWVLPYVLSIPTGVAIGLVVNEVQRVLDRARRSGQATPPTFRFREVVIEEGRTTVRELSGPADELLSTLKERTTRRAISGDE